MTEQVRAARRVSGTGCRRPAAHTWGASLLSDRPTAVLVHGCTRSRASSCPLGHRNGPGAASCLGQAGPTVVPSGLRWAHGSYGSVSSCIHLKQEMSRNAKVKINCLFIISRHFKDKIGSIGNESLSRLLCSCGLLHVSVGFVWGVAGSAWPCVAWHWFSSGQAVFTVARAAPAWTFLARLPTSPPPSTPVAPVPGLFPEGCPCGVPVGFVACAGAGGGRSWLLCPTDSSSFIRPDTGPQCPVLCHLLSSFPRTELTRWL